VLSSLMDSISGHEKEDMGISQEIPSSFNYDHVGHESWLASARRRLMGRGKISHSEEIEEEKGEEEKKDQEKVGSYDDGIGNEEI